MHDKGRASTSKGSEERRNLPGRAAAALHAKDEANCPESKLSRSTASSQPCTCSAGPKRQESAGLASLPALDQTMANAVGARWLSRRCNAALQAAQAILLIFTVTAKLHAMRQALRWLCVVCVGCKSLILRS